MKSRRKDAPQTRNNGDTMKITQDMIDRASSAGACAEAIKWLEAQQRTIDDLIEEHPEWLFWALEFTPDLIADHLTPERMDQCAERVPTGALQYAPDKLTPERLDRCAERKPWLALPCASYLLTPERLDWCAVREPGLALQCAADHLTPERLDWCAERYPYWALHCAAEHLTPERLDWCRQQNTRRSPAELQSDMK